MLCGAVGRAARFCIEITRIPYHDTSSLGFRRRRRGYSPVEEGSSFEYVQNGYDSITPYLSGREANQMGFRPLVRAGGKNVNKVATAVQLRFESGISRLESEDKKELSRIAGKK